VRRVLADVRTCVRLESSRVSDVPLRGRWFDRLLNRPPPQPLSLLASKFGGAPYVENASQVKDRVFIGQVNFAEATRALAARGFPIPQGMPAAGSLAAVGADAGQAAQARVAAVGGHHQGCRQRGAVGQTQRGGALIGMRADHGSVAAQPHAGLRQGRVEDRPADAVVGHQPPQRFVPRCGAVEWQDQRQVAVADFGAAQRRDGLPIDPLPQVDIVRGGGSLVVDAHRLRGYAAGGATPRPGSWWTRIANSRP
jgi:hypothetical protein